MEIGNYNFSYYQADIRAAQSLPELTIDVIIHPSGLQYRRPNTKVVFEYWPSFNPTDLTAIGQRFDLATQYKDSFDYGSVLLTEEWYHPAVMASWHPSTMGLSKWQIEGTSSFSGIPVMLLKTWYISTYGSWNQSWWDSVSSTNKYNDTTVMKWSAYFGKQIYQAWHLHMKSIGKRSSVIGVLGRNNLDAFESWFFPSPMWEYITTNYDMLIAYQYPECITGCTVPVSKSVDLVKTLRQKYLYKGMILQILTALWSDGMGTNNASVEFEEYKEVFPYVNAIIVPPYTNANNPVVDYPSRLVQFQKAYSSISSLMLKTITIASGIAIIYLIYKI